MNLKQERKVLIKLLKTEVESYGTQEKAAEQIGLSVTTIWRLKKGIIEANFDMLCKLSEYFQKKGVY